MINGLKFFDQPVKNNLMTHDNIQNIVAGQGDDYTTGCLLDNNYSNKHYKMIATDLSKKHWGKDADDNTTMFFIIKEAQEKLDFLQVTVKVF